ncbi:Synaptobrevin [Carpediemonas membranifera]|uniref:Synaptobrevin n=1 Tax=Carpediemonas membranifera TaxID=201153 RepID=A0A8J6E241_9EUKA|nr:Synaptobrevin [Carpediemonas membranifera]|eukprot:KAG9391417.1 Synaptobrevin [Carpediemonas membranifera]
MSLQYSAIVKGTTILVETRADPETKSLVRRAIDQMPDHQCSNSFREDDVFIHHRVDDKGLKFICVTNSAAGRRIPFNFISDIQHTFNRTFPDANLAEPRALSYQDKFARVLQTRMDAHSSGNEDKITRVQNQMGEVKDIMLTNVDKVIERGTKLEILGDNAALLKGASVQFKDEAKKLRRELWSRNFKLSMVICIMVVVVAMALSIFLCGGLTLPDCRSIVNAVIGWVNRTIISPSNSSPFK